MRPTPPSSQNDLDREAQGTYLSLHLKRSIFFHAIFFSCLILISIGYPRPKLDARSTLRVDLVGLPELKKSEVIEPAPIPPEPGETRKPSPPPPDVAQQTRPLPAPTDTPVALKKLRPLQKKSTSLTRTETTKPSKTLSALEKIRKEIQVKGNEISRGSQINGERITQETDHYLEYAIEKIRSFWALPPHLRDRGDLSAQVRVKIDRSGKLKTLEWLKKSGEAQFDDYVTESIQSAVPFDPPPAHLLGSLLVDGLTLGFPL